MAQTTAELRRLTDVGDIDELLETSREMPVMIFKHSLTCGISSAALGEYQRYLQAHEDDGVVHTLIEIQRARDVSRHVAERTGVRHESPQALLLRDGAVAWHGSHSGIHVGALENAVNG